MLWYRGAGRGEDGYLTRSPAPDTCPVVPPRCRRAWTEPVLRRRGAGRREELNHTHSPAPDTCPVVPPRCWRACPPSVTRLCMGTRQRPPLTTLARPVGPRGVCRENFLKHTLTSCFVRLLSRARRRFWYHVLLFRRDFGTRLCLLVPGEPRLRAGLVSLVPVRLSGTAPLIRRPAALLCRILSCLPLCLAFRRPSASLLRSCAPHVRPSPSPCLRFPSLAVSVV